MTDSAEKLYIEILERRLIEHIAKAKGLSLRDAFIIYYCSRMADRINSGELGLRYLDHRLLADAMFETEGELFEYLDALKSSLREVSGGSGSRRPN